MCDVMDLADHAREITRMDDGFVGATHPRHGNGTTTIGDHQGPVHHHLRNSPCRRTTKKRRDLGCWESWDPAESSASTTWNHTEPHLLDSKRKSLACWCEMPPKVHRLGHLWAGILHTFCTFPWTRSPSWWVLTRWAWATLSRVLFVQFFSITPFHRCELCATQLCSAYMLFTISYAPILWAQRLSQGATARDFPWGNWAVATLPVVRAKDRDPLWELALREARTGFKSHLNQHAAIGIQAFQFFHSFSQLCHHVSCDVIACRVFVAGKGQLMAMAALSISLSLSHTNLLSESICYQNLSGTAPVWQNVESTWKYYTWITWFLVQGLYKPVLPDRYGEG